MSLFVHYPRCTTCRTAKKWLDKHTIPYEEKDIVEDKPTVEELRAWYSKSNLPLKSFFNVNGVLYRQKKLKDKLSSMSEEEQLDLLASDGKMVKRPILVMPTGVLVGFKESEYKAALGKAVKKESRSVKKD